MSINNSDQKNSAGETPPKNNPDEEYVKEMNNEGPP